MLDADVLLSFSYYYLHKEFDAPRPHAKFHSEIWELFCSPCRRAAVAAPRNHAKSTAITLVYTLGNIVFREADFIIIVTSTEDAAKLFLAELKKQLETNEKLRTDFKIDCVNTFDLNTTTDFIVNFEDGHQARVIGKGANQPIRGAKWSNKRPNLIIGDDLEDPKEVLNPIIRRELRKKIRNDYEQAMSTYGRIRIVGTILHSDSLLEHLMPENQTKVKDEVVRTPLKTYSLAKAPGWSSIRYRAHPGIYDFSHILWPEQFTKERLVDIRSTFLHDNDAEGYAQEYLNEPIDETRAFFSRDGFLPMDDEDWATEKTWYCGVDLAVSLAQTADYSAFVVAGTTKHSELCVVDIYRDKMDTMDIVDNFFKIYDMYPGVTFILEKGPITRALEPVIMKTMLDKNKFFEMLEIQGIADKETRARPLQHRMRAKAIKFDQEATWYGALELELKQFPKGKNDDQVDALANIPLQLQRLVEGEKQENPSEDDELDDYEDEEVEEYSFIGISATTGY